VAVPLSLWILIWTVIIVVRLSWWRRIRFRRFLRNRWRSIIWRNGRMPFWALILGILLWLKIGPGVIFPVQTGLPWPIIMAFVGVGISRFVVLVLDSVLHVWHCKNQFYEPSILYNRRMGYYVRFLHFLTWLGMATVSSYLMEPPTSGVPAPNGRNNLHVAMIPIYVMIIAFTWPLCYLSWTGSEKAVAMGIHTMVPHYWSAANLTEQRFSHVIRRVRDHAQCGRLALTPSQATIWVQKAHQLEAEAEAAAAALKVATSPKDASDTTNDDPNDTSLINIPPPQQRASLVNANTVIVAGVGANDVPPVAPLPIPPTANVIVAPIAA
jgi:hypothetical protein